MKHANAASMIMDHSHRPLLSDSLHVHVYKDTEDLIEDRTGVRCAQLV